MAKKKTLQIGEAEYQLQSVPARWYLNHADQNRSKNGMKSVPYIQGLLDNVVVAPKGLKIDNFDDNIGDLEELVSEIESFLRGK